MLNMTQLCGFGGGLREDISFVGYATVDGGSSITYPAGTRNGDFLVLHGVNTSGAMPVPSGFTSQASYSWGLGYGTLIATKVVSGDTSVSVTVGIGFGFLSVWRNVSSVGTVGSFVDNNFATITVPGITTIGTKSIVLANIADRDVTIPNLLSGGWTSNGSMGATNFGVRMANITINAPGTSGGCDFGQNTTSYNSVGIMLELRN